MKTPRPIDREITRFREIATTTNDALLLADGPASPDAALLDLCAEALHLLTHAERTKIAARKLLHAEPTQRRDHGEDIADVLAGLLRKTKVRAEWEALFAEAADGVTKAKPLLSRIRKLPAATGAGIYAKAMVVRASITGAPHLAVSLAEDLIACKELRATLFPAEREDAREGQP
jgi:hypothetical protein